MSKDDRVDVVVRCRNEMPHTRATLDMLQRQAYPTGKILFVDCGSTDGSREAAQQRVGFEIIDLDPSQYIPGRVLNMGMNRTESDVVAFINADAIPDDPSTLGALVAPLINDDSIAAGYGRQLARPSADRLTKMDYKRVFGSSTQVAMRRGRFFSMAGSAISRAVWTRLPFDEELRYSEDVDWTHRVTAMGWKVIYVPHARFQHSHNYGVREQYQRRFGEGAADNRIHRLGSPSWLREWAKPLAGSLLRDARARIFTPSSVAIRCAQATGYYAGRHKTPSISRT